jgi:hypothetical protein
MYCRLLLKLILRDKAVWISTLVLAAAFSIPIAFNSPIYGPFFMKQGMQSFVDAFNTRAPQASGTDLSPEQQNDAELARYANAALAAQTDAAFLDSAESYYALMGEGFQSGSIVGDQETNDAALAYCRALSSSGITDIPASANDLPFLSFLPYAIAQAPSFLPFIPFLPSLHPLPSLVDTRARRHKARDPGGKGARAQIPAPYPNRVFDNWRGDRDAPRRPCAREYLRLGPKRLRADRVPDRLLP